MLLPEVKRIIQEAKIVPPPEVKREDGFAAKNAILWFFYVLMLVIQCIYHIFRIYIYSICHMSKYIYIYMICIILNIYSDMQWFQQRYPIRISQPSFPEGALDTPGPFGRTSGGYRNPPEA